MIHLACEQANLQIVNDVPHCSQWVAVPVSPWLSMSQADFQALLEACIEFGFAVFMVWFLVWAVRRI